LALAFLLGAATAALGGCPAEKDDPPPDVTGGGNGGSGGAATTCGDGSLDMGEACDDGNNSPDDGCTSCVVDACYTCAADAGAASTCSPKASGEACDGTKICDGNGACVECLDDTQCGGGYCFMNACAKCDDTVQNGDETDTDCGGAHCGKCMNAKKCGVGDDCTSTFCADGVCCNEACDGACLACDLAGFVGECSFIEKYGEDPSYGMGMACLAAEGEACSAGGACGKAIAQPCVSNAECASTRCSDPDMNMMKQCVGLAGDPCMVNEDCNSNMCMAGACM
jgi:hypothetical protein